MVSAIIPAYNEEATVGDVVSSVLGHPEITEIIVIDDASTDATSRVAREKGATVIRLAENVGKAGAMEAGVRAARGSVLVFLDADVLGLTHESLSKIIAPVLREEKEMYVAIRARRTMVLNKILHFFPILGGERALTRALWDSVPKDHKKGFEIEIALNYAAKRTKKGMGFELVYGLKHHIKEKKYGLIEGFSRRIKMSYEVVRISFAIYILGSLKAFLQFVRSLGVRKA